MTDMIKLELKFELEQVAGAEGSGIAQGPLPFARLRPGGYKLYGVLDIL